VTGPVVAVIQARMGSTRLPGKVLAPIAGLPLVFWTVGAIKAAASVDRIVVATTGEPIDDELAAAVEREVPVHRGSTEDVLARCWDAVAAWMPAVVVRATADNPFVDPELVDAQVAMLGEAGLDYVGCAGWPLGVGAEVARADALLQAVREARDPAEREHVMPFLYARPDRFRIGRLDPPADVAHARFTVDTPADLEVARLLAGRVGHGPPIHLAELESAIRDDPSLARLNAGVRQRAWDEG
jgi:spore coat polysaccharide biosynthesis protein SpsF